MPPRTLPAAFGPYDLLGLLGEGAMGRVYRARHRIMERVVAVKVLREELLSTPDAVARFQKEARAAAALLHPCIVVAYDAGCIEGTHYLAMEHVDGESLRDMLARTGPLPAARACAIAHGIARALAHAHDAGRIHRDVKPANVLMPRDAPDAVKVTDFGIARVLGEDDAVAPDGSLRVTGTPDYMAPEQWRDPRRVDGKADLFALGVVLFQMLTGALPFGGATPEEKLVALTLADAPRLDGREGVPAPLADLVAALLARAPADRPASAAHVAQELAAFVEERASMSRRSVRRSALASSSLLGREADIAAVLSLFEEARLVTLVGPGGVGKSRLQLDVGARLGESAPDGTVFVPLAGVRAEADVVLAFASAFASHPDRGQSLEDALVAAAAQRACVLLVDNCEHVVAEARRLVGRLLAQCPDLEILATSRERLGLADEVTFSVIGLGLPERGAGGGVTSLDRALASPAVRLFVERAGIELDEEDAPVVAEIVRRLDGLPLAIELAAARARSLSLRDLLARLDAPYRLLKGRRDDERTLRGTVDASHALLSPGERAVFRRLSVFAGELSIEAAEAVAQGATVARDDVLDRIDALVDKSMVLADTRGEETRYRLLETLRAYGAERLKEEGEEDETRDRHLAYFLGVLEGAQTGQIGSDQAKLFARLEAVHNDLRAAAAHAATRENPDLGLRLVVAMARFWDAKSHFGEGRRRIEDALSRKGGSPRLGAEAHRWAAGLCWSIGDYPAAAEHATRCLATAEELGLIALQQAAKGVLANATYYMGERAKARPLYEEALALARVVGDRDRIGAALHNLGLVYSEAGDPVSARPYFEESLAIRRAMGNSRGIGIVLVSLADVLVALGEAERAEAMYAESFAIHREMGDKLRTARALRSWSQLALLRGDVASAASKLREAFEHRAPDDRWGAAMLSELAARVLVAKGEPLLAARALGAAQALRAAIGCPVPDVDRPAYDALLAEVEARGGGQVVAALGEGRARGEDLVPELCAALLSD